MPGLLSGGTEIDRSETEMEEGHNGEATKKVKRRNNDIDHLAEERRLATQCPTPPTDPFPDFDSTPTATSAPSLQDAFACETESDKDTMSHPPLLAEALGHDSGPPPSSHPDNAVRSPLVGQEHVGGTTKPRARSNAKRASHESIRKLSASQMQALTSAPDSLPVAVVATPQRKPNGGEYPLSASAIEDMTHPSMNEQLQDGVDLGLRVRDDSIQPNGSLEARKRVRRTAADFQRPPPSARTLSSPPINRRPPPGAPMTAPLHNRRNSFNPLPRPAPLNLNGPPKPLPTTTKSSLSQPSERREPPLSPMLPTIPLPPMSLPTHLQLELAGQRPSPLYIHHSQSDDGPYESSAVKFERLLNALLLPPYLEQVMYFGTLACFDAWLYTFTILPMRFLTAVGVLVRTSLAQGS
ncbi:hypothetical protein O1611_g9451 [Lasiodiplodia mahajangana]|uniref:Uncharacterized protein n=1 Tax=Lasiodiplodia mahajangana TaxID=1108764 RepID=A0ACC2J996_9PEZI|nr:hypothetical protein O1611_g9451 [Lasiodiplodia mahajangana]